MNDRQPDTTGCPMPDEVCADCGYRCAPCDSKSTPAPPTDLIDPPCIGLDPDAEECLFCGATLDDECGTPGGAWRVGPGDPTEVQKWTGTAWATDCYLADATSARKWVLDNIREARA